MENKKIADKLEKLGLDNKEVKIYLCLLKQGENPAAKISKDTRIERTLVYYILEKIIDKGLASYKLKNNVKYYSASNPKEILEKLKEKESLAREILPLLKNLKNKSYDEEKIDVLLYQDFEGLKAATNEIFKEGDEFLILGEEGQVEENYPVYYQQYLKRLEDENITEKVLIREDYKDKIEKSKNSEFRFISREFLSPATTIIAGEKILITLWDKPLHNILIKSKKISVSYKNYFNLLWKQAEK